MNRCTECSNALVMSRDFEAWNESGICENCLSKSDNPTCQICQICQVECNFVLDEGPALCGGDFCISFPDRVVTNE